MTRIFKNSALLGGAALAIALASGSNAKAQIIGIPTGGDYSPYDTFAERWYDPGDWYGGGGMGRVGGQGGGGATSIDRARDAVRSGMSSAQDPRGLGTETLPGPPLQGLGTRGALGRGIGPGYDRGAGGAGGAGAGGLWAGTPGAAGVGSYGMGDRSRGAGPGGNILFQQGYSPYSGWDNRGGYRDFYDSPGSRPQLGPDPGQSTGASGAIGAGIDPRGERSATLGTGVGTAGGEVGVSGRGDTVTRAGRIVSGPGAGRGGTPRMGMGTRSGIDELFGQNDFVERGALPNPNYGRGPRYRGYYSDDWHSDSSAFDDWYDGTPSNRRSAPGGDLPGRQGEPGPLDRPGATDAPGALGEPGPGDRPGTGTGTGEPPATLREPGATGGTPPAGTNPPAGTERPAGTDRPATLRDEPGAGDQPSPRP